LELEETQPVDFCKRKSRQGTDFPYDLFMALDGVPAILIDPKGDLGNLLLTFPELRGEDFRPWINEEDALRKGMEPDADATRQAEFWKDGLAAWGEGPERIRMLRDKVEMAIYTPGSSSGIPVNIMAS